MPWDCLLVAVILLLWALLLLSVAVLWESRVKFSKFRRFHFSFTFCKIKNTAETTTISGDKHIPQGKEGGLVFDCRFVFDTAVRFTADWPWHGPHTNAKFWWKASVYMVESKHIHFQHGVHWNKVPQLQEDRMSDLLAGPSQMRPCALQYTSASAFRLKINLA